MTIHPLGSKLESLARCIDRLSAKLPSDGSGLEMDFDLQDILALNMQRAALDWAEKLA